MFLKSRVWKQRLKGLPHLISPSEVGTLPLWPKWKKCFVLLPVLILRCAIGTLKVSLIWRKCLRKLRVLPNHYAPGMSIRRLITLFLDTLLKRSFVTANLQTCLEMLQRFSRILRMLMIQTRQTVLERLGCRVLAVHAQRAKCWPRTIRRRRKLFPLPMP